MLEDYIEPSSVFQSLLDSGYSSNEKGQIKAISPLLDWPDFIPKQHIAIHVGKLSQSLLDIGVAPIDAFPLNWDELLVSKRNDKSFKCCDDVVFQINEAQVYIVSEKNHLFVGYLKP